MKLPLNKIYPTIPTLLAIILTIILEGVIHNALGLFGLLSFGATRTIMFGIGIWGAVWSTRLNKEYYLRHYLLNLFVPGIPFITIPYNYFYNPDTRELLRGKK